MNLDARKIFLTRLAWDNVAGLPLVLRELTGPSSKDKHVYVMGPQGTRKFIESTKTFSKTLSELSSVNCTEFNGTDQSFFADDNLTIKPIVLSGAKTNNAQFRGPRSMCYVCELAELPGKMQVEKVEALGIRSDLRLSLILGDSVILDDGTKVTPGDVLSTPRPGQMFIVVDCPSLETMDSLTSNHELETYRERRPGLPVELVIHMTPKHVLESNSYLSWIEKFGPHTQHIILNKEFCLQRDPLQKCEELQTRLHSTNPCVFPLFGNLASKPVSILPPNCIVGKNMLTYHFRPLRTEGFDESSVCDPYDFCKNYTLKNFRSKSVTWQLAEKKSRNTDTGLKGGKIISRTRNNMILSGNTGITVYGNETSQNTNSYSNTKQNGVTDTTTPEGDSGNTSSHASSSSGDFTVAFLGTGASRPSSLRNNPGLLLTTSDNRYLVLDCGEGFYSQLELLYGKEKAEEIAAKCSCIFISHIHADHHMGLIKLLLHRQKLSSKYQMSNLMVIGPKRLLTWLNKVLDCGIHKLNNSLQFKYLTFQSAKNADIQSLLNSLGMKRVGCYAKVLLQGKVFTLYWVKMCWAPKVKPICTCTSDHTYLKLRPVSVVHCHDSHGLVLEHEAGWKLVYSGDCRPSEQLVRAGRDATLLIHDATFRNEHAQNAVNMSHSTASEALEVSRRMQAKYTVLTHFSRRYNPRIIANLSLPPNVSTAWDHMVIRGSDLPTLHKIRPQISRALQKEFTHETKRKLFVQAELRRSQVSAQKLEGRGRMKVENVE